MDRPGPEVGRATARPARSGARPRDPATDGRGRTVARRAAGGWRGKAQSGLVAAEGLGAGAPARLGRGMNLLATGKGAG
jgi:hypothetical protein